MTTVTYLQEGMLIKIGGIVYEVDMVNDCRARCIPTEKVKVKHVMTDKKTGDPKEVEFSRSGTAINISPNSECEIIGYKKREKRPESISLKVLTKPVQDSPVPLKVVEAPTPKRRSQKRSKKISRRKKAA